MKRLVNVIKAICDIVGDDAYYEYDALCDWWQCVRELVLDCPCALRALAFTIVSKHVCGGYLKMEGVRNVYNIIFIIILLSIFLQEEDSWEKISHESTQWTMVILKLDHMAILGAILR